LKILLTGATGFIGANFLRQALVRGHQVAGLVAPGKVLPSDLASQKNLTWLHGKLADAPWSSIDEFGADVCVHTAWVTTPGVYVESPENFRFLEESLKFLRRMREGGTEQIVGLGTCVEYQIGREVLSEDKTALSADTPYARCKNDLRLALEAEAKAGGLTFAWTRVFYPYGPGEHPARLCSSLIQKLGRGEKVILKTPDSTKDYIYIADLAAALLTVVEKKFHGTINLGTGMGVTVREIAQTIAGLLGKSGLVEEISPAEKDPLGYVVADAGKLKGLGWKPGHTLKQGLEELVATI
jgi:nucleoside-diphosphate-sugar epimerase